MYVKNDPSTTRRPHIPAFDGLRALAVSAVLAFHNGFEWIQGGFLGVSLFFTLSGLLITSVLLSSWLTGPTATVVPPLDAPNADHTASNASRTNGLALNRFWVRRIRRLTPALLMTVVGSVMAFWAVGDQSQLATLRGDIPWTLTYTANWEHIAHSTSYLDLFIAPSALLHTWSLGIEEQMYLIVPMVAWACLGWRAPEAIDERARRVRLLVWVLGGLIVLSLAASALSAADSIDVAYYGTHTRAFELLSGSLLASVMLLRRLRGVSEPSAALGDLTGAPIAMSGADTEGRAARRRRRSAGAYRPLWTVLGLLGLVIMAVLWTVARQDDSRLYPLGLSVHTGATVAVLIAASRPGRLARLLSVAPARAIGRWSYGIYLYHWPVFVWLNPQRAHADGWWLFMLRCAVTVTLAALSYRFVEEPIRRGGALGITRGWSQKWALSGAVGLTVVVSLVFTIGAAPPSTNLVAQPVDLSLAAPPPDSGQSELTTTRRHPGAASAEGAAPATPATSATPGRPDLAGQSPSDRPSQAGAPQDAASTSRSQLVGTAGLTGPDLIEALDAYSRDVDVSTLPRPLRIMVFGDSVAESLGHGLTDWAEQQNASSGTEVVVWNIAIPECSFARESVRPRIYVTERGHTCNYWADYLPEHLADFQPDVIVLLSGQLDRQPVKLPEWGSELGPGDATYDQWLLSEYTELSQLMLSSGAQVLWLTTPCRDATFVTPSGLVVTPDDGPLEPINDQVVPQLAMNLANPRFTVLDFDALVCPTGEFTTRVGPITDARPDGLHFTTESADWLGGIIGPVLEELYADAQIHR